jgi:hypothetical protein
MGERSAYRILVGKPDGKRPLGRPRCRYNMNTHTQRVNMFFQMDHVPHLPKSTEK